MESATQALATQVGGHAGVMTTEDGSLLIKPAIRAEAEFYQALQQDPALASLREFTPRFLGTLKLEGKVKDTAGNEGEALVVEPVYVEGEIIIFRYPQSIVLENLSFSFLKPNILDIKLGTVLYDDGAPPDKVARMIETARKTTSLETGVRLTGFQVYDNVTSLAVNTPKSYGKSIQPSQLGEGVAKFFPVGTVVEGENPAPSSGLPLKSLLPILRAIRDEVAEIREAFANLELRMVGGSLLIVYEADWTRAEEGLKKFFEDEEEEDEEDEDDDDDDDPTKRIGPPFVVKLIDFAHTKLVPGAGPDEGVLKGMDTVLRLLDERLKEID
ncbi:hypothetical protein CVT24_007895 [Panaeolus cyanescens]|uniref:Kinase n=1 Tax=Panaeolus cyanescens TaxID=181874 RepID=A0A409VZL4_9AGAR|nr:hypothetical protein CVT24_007895 [Panaeolus cyanescens]